MFDLYESLPFFDQMLHGVHFMLCAFALLAACIPVFTEKGSTEHKFGGLLYLVISCGAFLLASAVAWYEASLVLFSFNAFCAYLLLSGWRAVHEKETPALIDWIIPGGLFALASFMALHAAIYDEGRRSLYLMFFALNAFYLAWRDFRHLRRRKLCLRHRMFLDGAGTAAASPDWLNRHVAGMAGSAMANMSVVVLTLLPIEFHWIWPATLALLAASIFYKEQRKKHRARIAVAKILHPKFRRAAARREDGEDIRRAA